jgi:hypothetical protein
MAMMEVLVVIAAMAVVAVMTMTASLSLCEARFFLVWAICRPWMRKFMRKS